MQMLFCLVEVGFVHTDVFLFGQGGFVHADVVLFG